MNYHPDYTVVHSKSVGGILQHDGFSWEVMGNHFIEESATTRTSQIMDQTVHEWLKACTAEQRRVFVQTVFGLVEDPDKEDVQEKNEDEKNDALQHSLEALREIDPQTRKTITSLLGKFISIGANRAVETIRQLPFSQMAEDLLSKIHPKEGNDHES